MKKKILIGISALALLIGFNTIDANAQKKTEKAVENTGKAIEKGAKAVGDKTAEVASKGASKVADQTYRGKMAPDGSNVYIDSHNKKYYIDKKGKKIYLKPSQIKDRPKS
ncbi:hypothetical protein Pedsa_2603 [Pseudopedobacter saltans DSM 12145]|uniref:PBCV-specific basic adaptor domain-containing protein n=1 Tax=Pseudopedobacter saltans (strain ATCC 51119 / DSM 12145 / JCM 21818 / CCUG 39354 / LMG 10337 / NBRC 100064 / NCIMB 13643) TaxID=762903 RepID=F0S5I1_PSESL|nr:hypothetical protein [Pseudopedobacter saltans]ADY53145.1 hypothetical protein Pedsa_2603 [Pseudopedobacter saltans DSM 12145]